MALPTPLTAVQVDGAHDNDEVRAVFRTGPYIDLGLLVAIDDPNLPGAITAGEVVVDNPENFKATLVSIAPLTNTLMTNVLITGTNFVDGMFVEVAETDGENINVVSLTEKREDYNLYLVTPGPYVLAIYDEGSQEPLDTLAVDVDAGP